MGEERGLFIIEIDLWQWCAVLGVAVVPVVSSLVIFLIIFTMINFNLQSFNTDYKTLILNRRLRVDTYHLRVHDYMYQLSKV